jgi:hypothetical protein
MDFTSEYIAFYKEILAQTQSTSIYNDAMDYIDEQFSNYAISDNQKAELTINFMANITNATITTAMQMALTGVNTKLKVEKEIENIELQNQKLTSEINVNNTNNTLLEAQKESQYSQTALIDAEKEYKTTQEYMLEVTNDDNKLIKALDATGDMIGTIGAGGLQIPQELIENYFTMINTLLGTSLNGAFDVTAKA